MFLSSYTHYSPCPVMKKEMYRESTFVSRAWADYKQSFCHLKIIFQQSHSNQDGQFEMR